MENGPDSIVLRYLRKIDAGQDECGPSLWTSSCGSALSSSAPCLWSAASTCCTRIADRVDVRLDRIDERIGRIERRLELTEADQ